MANRPTNVFEEVLLFAGFFVEVPALRVAFGDCTLDSGTRELCRGGRPVHLSPKEFRLLELLVQSRPNVLSKAHLFADLWGDTHISEVTLSSLIARIRRAIGDSATEPQFIRTVHGYGYAFCGDIRAVRETWSRAEVGFGPAFRLLAPDREIVLSEGENVLGRHPDCLLLLDDPDVSRHHARILVVGDTATLEDLGSKNGTYLQGKKITGVVRLSDGDDIQLGSLVVKFRARSQDGTTTTRTRPPGL